MDYDFIVVGSGSVGSAAGFYAVLSGLRVLMIDSGTPPHKSGSHHGDTRIIRCAYGEGAKYVPLILHARELWVDLCQKSGKEVLQTCGVVNLGAADSEFTKNVQISAQKYNLNVEKLTGEEVNERWPGINSPKDYIGIYEPDNGVLRSELAVASYVKLSKEAGADQLFDCFVKSVTSTTEGVEVVTDKGTFQARKGVVTAGTWAKRLLPSMPITPLRKVFMWHKAEECHRELPAFVAEFDGSHYYTFPADDKGFKVGKHNDGQTMNKAEELTPFGSFAEDATEVDDLLQNVFPGVGERLHGEACSYDMSPDEDFIIDKVPGCDNLMVITGLSGHGFKFSSALGEIAALFAQGKTSPIDVSAFSLKRFEQ